MAHALNPPFLLAAGVLCFAAVAKLRSPSPAANALRTLGLPAGAGAVRVFAAGELALGVWCAVAPASVNAILMAALYAVFAILSALLARQRQSCGCFGADESPASPGQSLLSAGLGAIALLGALAPLRSLSWLVAQPPGAAVVIGAGIVAGVYAVVLVYTQLPQAWSAWSAR